MRFTTVCALSALATMASAVFSPTGSEPTGNPIIHPGLGELMTAGSPYTITWTPTNQENISLVLLQGPSTNVIPIFTIVDSTANTGSYTWTVPANLAPGATGYGVELICADGTYQYSPQCGIANSGYVAASSASYGASVTMTLATGVNYTGPTASPTSYATAPTGASNVSIPVLTPSNSMTVPSSLQSTVAVTQGTTSQAFTATPSAAQPTQNGGPAVNAVKNVGSVALAGIVGALMF